MHSAQLLTLLAAGAAAAPTTIIFGPYSPFFGPTYRKVSYVDTFDNGPNTVEPGLNLVSGSAGGALAYNAFGYSTVNPDVLHPASPPEVASTGELQQNSQGQPGFRTLNSNVACIDLKSICYACYVNAEQDEVSSVEPCTVTLSGTSAYAGVPQAQVTLQYSQTGLGGSMTCAALPVDFTCLTSVNFQVTYAETGDSPLLTSAAIDNVAYDAYYFR